MAQFSEQSEARINLWLKGLSITIHAVVDQGYATVEEMEAALAEYVEGNSMPLDELIARAADETLAEEAEAELPVVAVKPKTRTKPAQPVQKEEAVDA